MLNCTVTLSLTNFGQTKIELLYIFIIPKIFSRSIEDEITGDGWGSDVRLTGLPQENANFTLFCDGVAAQSSARPDHHT